MRTIRGSHYRTGETVDIRVENGKIAAVEVLTDSGPAGGLPMIAPGLIDLQINGHHGVDLNVYPADAKRVHGIARELWKEGVTSFFPTVTTQTEERIGEAMSAIASACAEDPVTNSAVAGIHLEGPFISPEDGPRGAHNREYVRPPDWEMLQRWQEAAQGRIRIVTLSPEWPGSTDFIRRCTESGMTVAIGHTAAQPEQIREAVRAGARLSTHFGNGAHLMLPRHPNYLWEQLAQEPLWTALIADGFHLPESFLRVAIKVKGESAILVSDAVHLSGMPPGEYFSHKRVRVVKTPEGRLQLADQPQLLAGSAQLLPWGIAYLVCSGISPLSEAWEMASVRPAKLMGLPESGGLTEGSPADLVSFGWENGSVHVLDTYKRGELVHSTRSGHKKT